MRIASASTRARKAVSLSVSWMRSFAVLPRARAGRFITFGDVAKAKGATLPEIRRAMSRHLGGLVELSADRGWPMPRAIVVKRQNRETGSLGSDAREGSIDATGRFGFARRGFQQHSRHDLTKRWQAFPARSRPWSVRAGEGVSKPSLFATHAPAGHRRRSRSVSVSLPR